MTLFTVSSTNKWKQRNLGHLKYRNIPEATDPFSRDFSNRFLSSTPIVEGEKETIVLLVRPTSFRFQSKWETKFNFSRNSRSEISTRETKAVEFEQENTEENSSIHRFALRLTESHGLGNFLQRHQSRRCLVQFSFLELVPSCQVRLSMSLTKMSNDTCSPPANNQHRLIDLDEKNVQGSDVIHASSTYKSLARFVHFNRLETIFLLDESNRFLDLSSNLYSNLI